MLFELHRQKKYHQPKRQVRCKHNNVCARVQRMTHRPCSRRPLASYLVLREVAWRNAWPMDVSHLDVARLQLKFSSIQKGDSPSTLHSSTCVLAKKTAHKAQQMASTKAQDKAPCAVRKRKRRYTNGRVKKKTPVMDEGNRLKGLWGQGPTIIRVLRVQASQPPLADG
jgi:hypothetical protein